MPSLEEQGLICGYIVIYSTSYFTFPFKIYFCLFFVFWIISFDEWKARFILLSCLISVPPCTRKSGHSLPYVPQWEGIQLHYCFFVQALEEFY